MKIRKITPELIANLPRQTNGALLFQTLFQGEIDTFINSVLNEDLGHKHWANLRESILMMKTNKNLQPGTVLKHKKNDNEYYLCITPACDCYRPKNGYLFIIGTELTKDKRSEPNQTQYYTTNIHITWNASKFIFENEIAKIEGCCYPCHLTWINTRILKKGLQVLKDRK